VVSSDAPPVLGACCWNIFGLTPAKAAWLQISAQANLAVPDPMEDTEII
jgi:hypothetical protein